MATQPDPTIDPKYSTTLSLLQRFVAQAEFSKVSPIFIQILEDVVMDISQLQQDVQDLQNAGQAAANELSQLVATVNNLQASGPGSVTQEQLDQLAADVSNVTGVLKASTAAAGTAPTAAPATPTAAPTAPAPTPDPTAPTPEPGTTAPVSPTTTEPGTTPTAPAPEPTTSPEPAPEPTQPSAPPAGELAPEAEPTVTPDSQDPGQGQVSPGG